jgi:hypothetical protein
MAQKPEWRGSPGYFLYDPISDDAYAWVIKEAGMRASEEVGKPHEMNPRVRFD